MIFPRLGIYGWKETDENLLLASLLTGDPVLLIGSHGTAKTGLFMKIAEALGLCAISYDASKALFEDILGYPNPKKLLEGRVSYIGSDVTKSYSGITSSRTTQAAYSMACRTSSRSRSGYSLRISSADAPWASWLTMTETGIRIPRMHARPPMISGSKVIRSNIVISSRILWRRCAFPGHIAS